MTDSNSKPQVPAAADVPPAAEGQQNQQQGQRRERRERRERRTRRDERDSEWQERVVQIRRVSKTVKGGKKMSFRAILVVGNEKGQVGVGVGKASDVIGAVRKGVADGKKHLVKVPLTSSNSIPTVALGRDGAASVLMRPAAPGTGVIAGDPSALFWNWRVSRTCWPSASAPRPPSTMPVPP